MIRIISLNLGDFQFFSQNPYSGTWTLTREPGLVLGNLNLNRSLVEDPYSGTRTHTREPGPVLGNLPGLKKIGFIQILGREVGPISVTHMVVIIPACMI